jgi:hypothetical protein
LDALESLMKKYRHSFYLFALMASCNMAGFKDQLADATTLSKKFPADNVSVGTTVTTDHNYTEHGITITNLQPCKYSDISLARLTSCVSLEYYHLVPDSARDDLFVTVKMETTSKDGFVTSSSYESNSFNNSELKEMDSLFTRITQVLDMARANLGFAGLSQYFDTIFLPDSVLATADSFAVVLFGTSSSVEYDFYGYQELTVDGSTDPLPFIWIYISNDKEFEVIRFGIERESGLITGMSINPDDFVSQQGNQTFR